jgi:hypothetical protein
MDTIKGLALIATFIGFLTIFAMWVSLWDNVWRVSVEPTRASIYAARIGPSAYRVRGRGGRLRVVA